MDAPELAHEIAAGVEFWGVEQDRALSGIMGVQVVQDVLLIRHAYVLPQAQGQGIGSDLLGHLIGRASRPILIGTWAAASWAIRFYERRGFALVSDAETPHLLRTYWSIPERQIDASVVLRSHYDDGALSSLNVGV